MDLDGHQIGGQAVLCAGKNGRERHARMLSRASRARCARRRTLRERSVRRSVVRFERLDALFQGFQLLLRARQKLGLRVEAFTRNQIPLLEIGTQYRAEIVFQLAAQAAQSRRQRSEEHTSELQSLMRISYAVFCLKKKTK